MLCLRPAILALVWSCAYLVSAAPASATDELHERDGLTASDGAAGDGSSQSVFLDGTETAVSEVGQGNPAYHMRRIPSAVADNQITDGPPAGGGLTLSIERGPGFGFCPQPGTLLSATVWTDGNGITWLQGEKIVRAPSGATDCLFGPPGPYLKCYLALAMPDRPLTDQQSADLAGLIGTLPPTCDAWYRACDPGIVTYFTINSHLYTLGCGSREPCANTLVSIGRLLDDVARTFVLDLDAFEGLYPEWGTQQNHPVDLGFSLFRVDRVAIYWAGSVYSGVFDCNREEYCGLGGSLTAGLPGAHVVQWLLHWLPDAWVPFSAVDSFDLHSGTGLSELLDGAFNVQIAFPWISDEWPILLPPAAQLDAVVLLVGGSRMHDADGDGLARSPDLASWANCLDGPGRPARSGCGIFDADRDQDIDLFDAAGFQLEFDGP